MADTDTTPEDVEPGLPAGEMLRLDLPSGGVTTLSETKRILGIRIAPYGVVAESRYGPLMFERGAFGDVEPRQVRLRMDHENPPTGTGRSFSDREGFAFMEFAVSRTQRGDEQLELAKDGTSTGASVGFREKGKPRVERIDGKRVLVFGPDSVGLEEVSTTWQPTFADAGVVYVMNKEVPPVADATPDVQVVKDETDKLMPALIERVLTANEATQMATNEKLERMLSAMGDWQSRFDEMARSQFNVPAGESRPKPKLHDWVEITLRRMAGQQISPTELKTLALDDVVTTEQPGLVPAVFTADYDDLINRDRPFLSSTREVVPPRTGNSMTLPIITTRAVAGTQAGGEKTDLTTTATKVGTGTFAYQSVFGGADISIQMINRADPSFFDLLTGDIAMAYALDAEVKAIEALLAGYTDSTGSAHTPVDGGTIDPEALSLGAAWKSAITAYKRAPDTIWMNATAVAAFIDAKEDGTNRPLYSNLAAAFTAGGGPGGSISGLRPVYVPALDDESVDVIVGPSRGFVWAEDPARTLQADNPGKAGRDIVLAGGIFPAPRFANAFTTYTLSS